MSLIPHNLNPFMVSLQCLGSDAIPSHFIHKSSHRKQVTTHSLPWPPVPAESEEKVWWFEVTMSSRCCWGHCNVQGKLCAVALHHTLEISKKLPHVISHTRGSLSNIWPDNVSWEQRMKNMPQEPTSPCRHNAPCQLCISSVIYYLCRHKH